MIRNMLAQFNNKKFKITIIEDGHSKSFKNNTICVYNNTEAFTINGDIHRYIKFKEIENIKNNQKSITFLKKDKYSKQKFIISKIS
ncbi:TPA: hypothetical protein PTV74_003314 [Clostridium botulinum]|nr:hypothetical protein [Clostridium botulinum]HDK7206469.1 hypothetical protein [Clostridium botulinum]HDK7210204.1 hypothetical protein [Clostridium botulinum]HDK7265654.1 hypothetical protein [Clostridium botulinum]HDK7269501.1 hypothetical protein [Clostridium botulinum]